MSSRPTKKRKLTPPHSEDEGDSRSNTKFQKAFFKNAAQWDLEDQYHAKKGKKSQKEAKHHRLPLKLRDGRVQTVSTPVEATIESDEDWLDGADDVSADDDEKRGNQAYEKPQVPVKQQIREAKEEMAKIATSLTSSPDEHVGAFKALNKLGESKIPAIITLSLVTRMAIYKDMIPGYRIRQLPEDASKEKLSKDVRTLRNFETSLVSGYQIYLKELAKYAKAGRRSSESDSIAGVAITCACTLLTSVPHFNFRGDLIKILVGKLSTRRVDKDFVKCLDAFKELFGDDDEGRPSFEAVSTLGKMMRSKEYDVDESVLNLFLHLRLLSEFSGRASKESVDLPTVGPNGKKPKMKKQFRTKRLRKDMKEQKALDKDMAAADALVSHEERDRMQSETLRAVFGTYFRVLKLNSPHLMGAVLEGLAKYSHLINQDFFGDLLEALKDLIRNSDSLENANDSHEDDAGEDDKDEERSARNSTREALLCTVTAFALLAGQDAHNARSDLHLDLSFFSTHLWQNLIPISLNPDLELGARSLHLPDPDAPRQARNLASTSGNRVNLQTTTVLLIRCLTAVLLPPWNIRSTPPLRLASFAKQLMSTSLHVPEKSAQAILALLADVSSTHGRKIAALWNTEERKGDGVYNALAESEQASNPFATSVWEGELLRRHYCPKIREGVKMLEKSIMNER